MGLTLVDLGVILIYLTGITMFDLHFRRQQRSLRDYFLADNAIPWWAISLSIVAAETSTLTVISIPGLGYATNFAFLQLVFGYLIGRVVISFLLLPHYFRGELYTAYQLIERRFGKNLRSLTAALFLLTRAAAEGVRVFAVAIVVKISLGAMLGGLGEFGRDVTAIAIVTALTLIYTFEGGLAAVIWTDVIQIAIYVTGTLVGVYTILHLVPGGWSTVADVAGSAGKFRVFDFHFNLHDNYTFLSGLIGGAFLTTASHGTDQLIVQRLLSARTQKESKFALLSSGVFVLFQFALFLLVGAMLFVFYKLYPPAVAFAKTDFIFPTFIVTRMPQAIRGLLIAAILAAAMSNLSAALNSLASTSIMDLYARLRPRSSDEKRLKLARLSTIGWALILFLLAILARNGGRVVEVGLSIASVAYGALLGVFLLGVLTKRATETGSMVGMLCGFLFNIYLWQFTKISFTWWVAFGSALTFAVGYLVSLATSSRESQEPAS